MRRCVCERGEENNEDKGNLRVNSVNHVKRKAWKIGNKVKVKSGQINKKDRSERERKRERESERESEIKTDSVERA